MVGIKSKYKAYLDSSLKNIFFTSRSEICSPRCKAWHISSNFCKGCCTVFYPHLLHWGSRVSLRGPIDLHTSYRLVGKCLYLQLQASPSPSLQELGEEKSHLVLCHVLFQELILTHLPYAPFRCEYSNPFQF